MTPTAKHANSDLYLLFSKPTILKLKNEESINAAESIKPNYSSYFLHVRRRSTRRAPSRLESREGELLNEYFIFSLSHSKNSLLHSCKRVRMFWFGSSCFVIVCEVYVWMSLNTFHYLLQVHFI